MDKYAKALVAAVLAGGAAYESAVNAGGTLSSALVAALVAAVVTGAVTWGVPNETVKTIASAVERNPASDVTTILPRITTGGNA